MTVLCYLEFVREALLSVEPELLSSLIISLDGYGEHTDWKVTDRYLFSLSCAWLVLVCCSMKGFSPMTLVLSPITVVLGLTIECQCRGHWEIVFFSALLVMGLQSVYLNATAVLLFSSCPAHCTVRHCWLYFLWPSLAWGISASLKAHHLCQVFFWLSGCNAAWLSISPEKWFESIYLLAIACKTRSDTYHGLLWGTLIFKLGNRTENNRISQYLGQLHNCWGICRIFQKIPQESWTKWRSSWRKIWIFASGLHYQLLLWRWAEVQCQQL